MSDSGINRVRNEHGRHICTLDSEDANAFRPYDRSFKSAMTISSRNPNTRHFFRSLTLVEKERQRHIKMINNKIIHPLSEFRLYWEAFQLAAMFLGLLIIPINFVHGPEVVGHHFAFGFNFSLALCEILIDLLYVVDVIMCFYTGFVDKQKIVHLNCRVIARKYMSTVQFFLDIPCSISTMTILLIYSSCREENYADIYLCWLRLIGAIKILRLFRFSKYMTHVCELLHHYYYFKLSIQYMTMIIITLHWLTCLYILFEQNVRVYTVTEWGFDYCLILSYEYEEILTYEFWYMYICAQNIVVRYVLWISSTYSFGSIFERQFFYQTSEKQLEIVVFVIYSSIGFILSNLLMILLLQMILSMNATESKYHSIMSQLLNYMRLKALPRSMKERFICYYEYRFQKNYFREATIMGMLSESLRHDINLHSCRSLIQNVSILRDLPLDIISEVVFHLKHEVYLYNDIIVKAETVGDRMYFIANGSVAVLTPTGREICHLQDGSYFGEIALISNDQKRTANVIAIEICEVYCLERTHFNNCFQKNTMFYKKIQQTAQERKDKTILLEELHKKYLIDQCVSLAASADKKLRKHSRETASVRALN